MHKDNLIIIKGEIEVFLPYLLKLYTFYYNFSFLSNLISRLTCT